jgi:hypothetical protein
MHGRKLPMFGVGLALGLTLFALMAPTGGYPSRPRFQLATIGQAADADLLLLQRAGSTQGSVRAFSTGIGLFHGTGGSGNGIYSEATGTTIQGPFTVGGITLAPQQGTFTLTLSTGCTTTPQVVARYFRIGNIATLSWPDVGSCTSNATTLILTGLPAALTPVATAEFGSCRTINNGGAVTVSHCNVAATQITVSNGPSAGNAFTASGTKQIFGNAVSYPLN